MSSEGTAGPRDPQVVRGDEVDVKNVIDPLPFYVLLVDSDHNVIMANEALYKTYDLKPEDVAGAYCPKLIHGMDCPFEGCPVEEAHEKRQSAEREMYDENTDTWMMAGAYLTSMVTIEGKPIYLHVVEDITAKKKADQQLAELRAGLEETVALRTRELELANQELQREIVERGRAEEAIRQLAYFDSLTGLPNRTNFSDLLTKAIQAARRHDRRFGVALLDLDSLKVVNDTMGHDAGDKILRLVGKRLEERLRNNDTAARMGGDEFLFIFTEIEDPADIGSIGDRLLSGFEEPFSVDGSELRMTASVGCAVYPDDGLDEIELVKRADLAMYRAKTTGKNRFCRLLVDEAPDIAS